ncbi:unnamed protein product [Protopolystoma xenopodis]|uniref:Uncharacterized protein n=1 Tax=Protopolystoma xenopodis TaxID=117903 RepID=A0A3S5FG74_9PLAT|nr:unnamed protein product [Protopolystoma xenopodis]
MDLGIRQPPGPAASVPSAVLVSPASSTGSGGTRPASAAATITSTSSTAKPTTTSIPSAASSVTGVNQAASFHGGVDRKSFDTSAAQPPPKPKRYSQGYLIAPTESTLASDIAEGGQQQQQPLSDDMSQFPDKAS